MSDWLRHAGSANDVATLPDTVWSIARTSGTPLLLRAAVFLAGVGALACTDVAGDARPAVVTVTAVLILWGTFVPDGHSPLLALTALCVHWVVAVDDVTTPWAMVMGASVAILHIAAAAASISPTAATWTAAMRRRWLTRTALVVPSVVPAWATVAVLDEVSIGSSGLLLGAALVATAAAVVWLVGSRSG